MLCGKIIITNENREDIQKLLNSLEKRSVFFGLKEKGEAVILNFNADDETVYEISCDVADYIAKTGITRDIYRYIEKQYSCFNRQEKEIICNSALNCREAEELAGRIYVFLKTEKNLNPDGFYRFMCTDITDAVLGSADEEAERLISLNEDRDFIEFLKCFASMSSANTEKVDLVAEKNSIKIVNAVSVDDLGAEFGNLDTVPEDILSELVALNPVMIVVHGKDNYEKSEFSVIINEVFENRVFFCEGCSLCPDTNDK